MKISTIEVVSQLNHMKFNKKFNLIYTKLHVQEIEENIYFPTHSKKGDSSQEIFFEGSE